MQLSSCLFRHVIGIDSVGISTLGMCPRSLMIAPSLATDTLQRRGPNLDWKSGNSRLFATFKITSLTRERCHAALLSTCGCCDSGCTRCALTAVAFLDAKPAGFSTSGLPAAVGILAVQGFGVNEDGRKHNLSMKCRQTDSKLVQRTSDVQKHACILDASQDAEPTISDLQLYRMQLLQQPATGN